MMLSPRPRQTGDDGIYGLKASTDELVGQLQQLFELFHLVTAVRPQKPDQFENHSHLVQMTRRTDRCVSFHIPSSDVVTSTPVGWFQYDSEGLAVPRRSRILC